MKPISRKEKIAQTEKKLLKLRGKLEERLHKTELAMIGAKAISKELEKLKGSR